MDKNEKTKKNIGGRPPFYKTPEEMQKKIDAFFEERSDKMVYNKDGSVVLDKFGEPVLIPNPPTVSGLALYLGFCDRHSLYDYGKQERFSHTVKRAIERIADYAEQHLYIGKATGPIYWLKNHGWSDKSSLEVTGKDGAALNPPTIIIQPVKSDVEE